MDRKIFDFGRSTLDLQKMFASDSVRMLRELNQSSTLQSLVKASEALNFTRSFVDLTSTIDIFKQNQIGSSFQKLNSIQFPLNLNASDDFQGGLITSHPGSNFEVLHKAKASLGRYGIVAKHMFTDARLAASKFLDVTYNDNIDGIRFSS